MDITTLEQRSDLGLHQQVVLYPSFAYPLQDADAWRAIVYGFAYKEGEYTIRQRMFLRVLKQVLQVDEGRLDACGVFQDRVRGFLLDPQRAKTLVVRLGESKPTQLRRSRRNGQLRDHLTLSRSDLGEVAGTSQRVDCHVLLQDEDDRRFAGSIDVLPRRGVSVISDIDDTIKVSQVANRGRLLRNTFINPFAPVPGMAELYQAWREAGAAFHYVSSSPWQLYGPLREMLVSSGFPDGSYHLRTLRFADPSVVKLFINRKRNKFQVIKTILRLFPERRFILVGDSGEKDPEIYGSLTRRFPSQIERILIRRVPGRRWTRRRVARAFRNIPRERWQTFRGAHQVKPICLDHAS